MLFRHVSQTDLTFRGDKNAFWNKWRDNISGGMRSQLPRIYKQPSNAGLNIPPQPGRGGRSALPNKTSISASSAVFGRPAAASAKVAAGTGVPSSAIE
jgi:hypothetical protein